jgi:hypothetical protein
MVFKGVTEHCNLYGVTPLVSLPALFNMLYSEGDQWATLFRKARVLPIGLTHCIVLPTELHLKNV